ncbi:extracellular solute-binding protein, partial [Pseudactinotalea sp.]|uniref:extracellular solute-binding protein n=1 Tax=Pseudactinotalea sp. TaxID=1926260 RepID=UPI003B3A646A
ATMYRADMFAEAGVTEAPRTIAELTEALRALKEAYGSDSNYYPMSGRDSFFNLAYAFGAGFAIEDGHSRGFYDTSSGGSFDLMSDSFREMVEWYNQIYSEGLIDPIWVEGAMTEEDWQSQFLTSGASVTTDFFTRPAWFLQNGGPENDPDFDVQVMMPLEGEDGEQMLAGSNARWDPRRVFVVDARSEQAETIVTFLDWLYTDEGQQLMHYGVEGETFEMVDGQPQYTVRYDDVADNPDGTPVWAFHQDRISFAAPLENDAYYAFLDDFTGSYAQDLFANYTVPHPTIRFTPEQEEERSAINAALQPAMLAGITAFTTGDRPMTEWDAFLAEMDELGYSRSIEITDEALAAMGS